MKKTDEPGWPMTGGLPFMPFPLPGMATAAAPAAPSLLDGVSGGMDLIKDFWSKLPGTTPVPGFLVPTVNVEELDKRIADLRAAEKWVEVNLNLLRTTIQGLEVQRQTIAAIHSLSAMAAPATSGAASAPVASPADRWLGFLQEQFAQVAGAAIAPSTTQVDPRAAPAPAARKRTAATAKRKSRTPAG